MSQTLDAVLSKGQTMPEKNRFPAVLTPVINPATNVQPYTASSFAQYAEGVGTVRASGGDLGGGSETLLTEPVPFRKSKRACSTTDNERVEAEALAITFQPGNLRREAGADPSFTTTTTLKASAGDQTPHVCYPLKDPNDIACEDDRRQNGIGNNGDPAFTLRTAVKPGVMTSMAVRRLTPVECERLQGFPDNWSRISWKGKPEEDCPDGPRYKACGNSMAVPCMFWIGERIAAYELNNTSQNHETK